MEFYKKRFRRKFSLNNCRNLSVELARMTFSSDFYDGDRGDLYPALKKAEGTVESWERGVYSHSLSEGVEAKPVDIATDYYFDVELERMVTLDYKVHLGPISERTFTERYFAPLFPYATYKMTLLQLGEGSECGFTFFYKRGEDEIRAELLLVRGWHSDYLVFSSPEGCVFLKRDEHKLAIPCGDCDNDELKLEVSLRPGAFDVFVRERYGVRYITTFKSESFECSEQERIAETMGVALHAGGEVKLAEVSSCIDSGLGLADMRSVRYENSEVIVEDGRVYFTASIRRIWGTHQGVFSWVPGTSDIKMVGALFFDAGDGKISDDVATSLIFNRMTKKWHLHVASFSHGHVVGSAIFDSDVRFGVNIVDIKLMPEMSDLTGSMDELMLGKQGDEDPDLIYDERRGKWLFSVCRRDSETRKYRYHFFESDYPDRDFKFIGKGVAGEETGGSIMDIDGEIYFICGNSRKLRSDYRVYKWGEFDRFEAMEFDYPDGGFRGWGTVLPIKIGTRKRYFHITFDRVRMSEFEWSYGNFYCFEAESEKL